MTGTLLAALQAAAAAPSVEASTPGWLDPLFLSFVLAIAGVLYVIARLLHSPADTTSSKEP